MSKDPDFTPQQLRFLQLWHIACIYDCTYIIDMYCENEFDTDQISALTDDERETVAILAEKDVFEHAIDNGYRPSQSFNLGESNGYLS